MNDTHPIEVAERIARKYGDDVTLQFGVYAYVPQTIEDQRIVYDVPYKQAHSWFADTRQRLGKNKEIALQSVVRIGGANQLMQIPMVDFHNCASASDLKKAIDRLREFGLSEFLAYHSGESYHLYGLPLIETERLTAFFGRILLLNEPDQNPIVDWRWIGHRLIAGYGSLRWTANSPQHKKEPTRIEV